MELLLPGSASPVWPRGCAGSRRGGAPAAGDPKSQARCAGILRHRRRPAPPTIAGQGGGRDRQPPPQGPPARASGARRVSSASASLGGMMPRPRRAVHRTMVRVARARRVASAEYGVRRVKVESRGRAPWTEALRRVCARIREAQRMPGIGAGARAGERTMARIVRFHETGGPERAARGRGARRSIPATARSASGSRRSASTGPRSCCARASTTSSRSSPPASATRPPAWWRPWARGWRTSRKATASPRSPPSRSPRPARASTARAPPCRRRSPSLIPHEPHRRPRARPSGWPTSRLTGRWSITAGSAPMTP